MAGFKHVAVDQSDWSQSERAPGELDSASGDRSYPETALAVTGLFSLYLLTWYLEFGQRFPALGAIRFEFLVGASLSALAIQAVSSRPSKNRSTVTPYIWIYFVYLTLHLGISQYPEVSSNQFVDHVLKLACVALFIYAFVRNPTTLRLFMAVLLLAFAKIGEEALLGTITGSMVWENQGIMRLNGTQGSRFGHPNSLSGFAVCTLPLILYLLPVVQRRWKICLLVLLVLIGNIVIFTGSRTGYIAILGLVGFFWLRSAKKLRLGAVLVLVAAVGLPFVPKQYAQRFSSSFEGEEAEGHSKEERMDLANDAWQLFLENPQGLGIYAFRYARVDRLHKSNMDPHNLYLQALVDTGLPGFLLFLLLVAAIARELRKTDLALTADINAITNALAGDAGPPWASEHLRDLRFMHATSSAFLAFLFARMLLGFFGHDLYEIYWWLAAGTSMALVNMKEAADTRTAALLASSTSGPASVEEA